MKQIIIQIILLIQFSVLSTYAASFPALVPQTGQTTCYEIYDAYGNPIPSACSSNSGQDGVTQQFGWPIPDPHFVDNGDQTVTDKLTGLIWTKDANLMKTRDPSYDTDGYLQDGGVTWQRALSYVKKLNTENYAGHNDWRLPNRNELESLANLESTLYDSELNGLGFSNVDRTKAYWSSTTHAGIPVAAWIVMVDGYVQAYDKLGSSVYVWPVRSEQTASTGTIATSRTGQTLCYNTSGTAISCNGTGQDGEQQAGATWPSPRFIENADQKTMSDNLTGLIWIKNGNENFANSPWKYNFPSNTTDYLGYNDWRRPNRNELESLINVGQADPYAWLNGQGFLNVQPKYYWSSSTKAGIPEDAWYVGYDGSVQYYHKSVSTYGTWLVRGGRYNWIFSYTVPTSSTSLTIPISSFSTIDNAVVTGYCLSKTNSSAGCTWQTTAPASYHFSGYSEVTQTINETLYAFVKDAGSNISTSKYANISITITPAPPSITAFTIPASSNTLAVSISTLSATDNVAVTGYMITETATPPLSTSVGWSTAIPVSYTFSTVGIKTLYAWAKDAAGYVSQSATASILVGMSAITASVNGGNGTVICTSPINNGATSTCAVTPAAGYQLATFTDNGVDKKASVSGSSYSIINVTANHTIVATFTTPVNGNCGTSNGGTFTVAPATNFCITGIATTVTGTGPWSWTCAGINGGVTVSCNANIKTYSVNFAINGNGTLTGTASQVINYAANATTVTAVPATGHHFVSWTEGTTVVSTNAALTITNVTAAHNYVANFAIDTFAITFATGGNGSLTGTASQTVNYAANATTVTAVPATGYHFVNWTEGATVVSTNANLAITNVTAAHSYIANFAINTYNVNFAINGSGTLTGTASQTINHGDSATTVTAASSANYHFVNWKEGATVVSTNASLTITNVTIAHNYTANFAIDNFEVNFSSGGNGTLTGTASQAIDYAANTATVTAVPATGYHFVNWTEGATVVSTNTALAITNVTAAHSYTGNFAINTYNVNFASDANGSLTGTTSQTINYGASATTVTALPAVQDSSYYFVNWTGTNGFVTSTENPLTITNVTANQTITANFAMDTTGPTLTLSTLTNGNITNNATINISGTVYDANGAANLKINDVAVTAINGSFSYALTLQAGENVITTVTTDIFNNQTTDTRTITLDTTAPTLTVSAPADNSKTAQSTATITGTTNETSTVSVIVNNGTPQSAAITGTAYNVTINLASGLNTITITATDLANNTASAVRSITYDDTKPSLEITAPNQDITTAQGSITIGGIVSDAITTTTVSVDFNNQTLSPTVTTGAFSQLLTFPSEGTWPIVVTATDEVGNVVTATRNIIHAVPVNGVCGSSNGLVLGAEPTTSLCSIGTASAVSATYPWNWTCSGSKGGTTASCSASSSRTATSEGATQPTIADALKVLQAVVGITPLNATEQIRYDVAPLGINGRPLGNGVIDGADIILILRRSIGIGDW